MELNPIAVQPGEDVVARIHEFLASRPGAWVASCSGSLASIKLADGAEQKGPFSLHSLHAPTPSAKRLLGAVYISASEQKLIGAQIETGLVAPPHVSLLIAAPPSLIKPVVAGIPATPPSGDAATPGPPPVPTGAGGIPAPPGGSGGIPPPPGMGHGPGPVPGLPPPPVIKITKKPAMPSSTDIIDEIQNAGRLGGGAAGAKKMASKTKNKALRNRIKIKKKKVGEGKNKADILKPDDTKLDLDRLFYEFRKLLLKPEMPTADESKEKEWFDPKLVAAIRAADVNTGSGYVLSDQLRDIVERWMLDQSAFFQLTFLARHVTKFVIEKFLNRYPKVKMDDLLIDPAVKRLNMILDKYKEGVGSRLRILPKEASLDAIIPQVIDPQKTVIALDFDQTITLVQKKKTVDLKKVTKTMEIRGGNATKKALESLVDKGALCCIATAQTPSVETMISLVQEVRHLGLARVFDVEPFDPKPIAKLLKGWGSNDTMPLEKLTTKLVVLISLNTDRRPSDMERMGYSTLSFEGDGSGNEEGKGKPLTVKFRLFGNAEENPSLANSWTAPHALVGMKMPDNTGEEEKKDGDKIAQGKPSLEKQVSFQSETQGDIEMCTVRCIKAYCERTKELRAAYLKKIGAPKIPEVFIDDVIREREAEKARRIAAGDTSLLPPPDETEEQRKIREAEEDELRYGEEDIRNEQQEAKNHKSNRLLLKADGTGTLDADTIDKMTKAILQEAGVPQDKWNEALGHPVETVDLAESKVQYTRYGNCMAARYNKPEAVIDFINKERPHTTKCIFVDDNSDNCWNMFAHFANKERLGEPLIPPKKGDVFKRNNTTPVTVYWYTPVKKSEVFNAQARQLVEELSKMPDPNETKKSEPTEDQKNSGSK